MRAFALIISALMVHLQQISTVAINNDSAKATCTCVPFDNCANFVKSDVIKTTCQSFLDVCCEAEHLVANDDSIRFDGATSGSAISSNTVKPLTKRSAKAVDGEEQCTCVPYYQCKASSRINPDAVGLIDVRIPDCKNYLDICCKSGDVITEDVRFTESSSATKSTTKTATSGKATTTN